MGMYRYREGLGEDDFRKLTKKFLEIGNSPGVITHYQRLDGKGGFILEEVQEDPERSFEFTLKYIHALPASRRQGRIHPGGGPGGPGEEFRVHAEVHTVDRVRGVPHHHDGGCVPGYPACVRLTIRAIVERLAT
jgi:hypothetical protein